MDKYCNCSESMHAQMKQINATMAVSEWEEEHIGNFNLCRGGIHLFWLYMGKCEAGEKSYFVKKTPIHYPHTFTKE